MIEGLEELQEHLNKHVGTYRLDENKNAIRCSVIEWSTQLEDMKKNHIRHVADETIDDKRISTVWLGVDHQWDDNGPPLIYETMVFDKGRNDIYCDRYSTWKEAEEGHKKAVQWVKGGCKDED